MPDLTITVTLSREEFARETGGEAVTDHALAKRIHRAALYAAFPDQQPDCARESGWCDGVVCREHGVHCPNADPKPRVPQPEQEGEAGDWRSFEIQQVDWAVGGDPGPVYAVTQLSGPPLSEQRAFHEDEEGPKIVVTAPAQHPTGPLSDSISPEQVYKALDEHGMEAVEIGTKEQIEKLTTICPECGADDSGGGIDEPPSAISTCTRCVGGRVAQHPTGLSEATATSPRRS